MTRPASGAGLDAELRASTLPGGTVVVTERMPEVRSVTVGAWVKVGGRDEAPELAGASHFLEHLLFKGTERRTARQIAEAIDAVGGEFNAFTAREHTAYYARLPHTQLDLGLAVLGDVLTRPAFRPGDVEAERQVIVEELLMNLDVPEDRAHTLLADAVFPGHPLGRDVLGERTTVEALTRDQIAGFFDRWYRPEAMVVTAAGHLEHDAVVAGVEQHFAREPGGRLPTRVAPDGPPRPLSVEPDDTEQAHVCLGWRALDHHDDDRWALAVANQVLGGGMSSRLFQEVREERGLAYSVYSASSSYDDTGMLAVYCGTAPRRVAEAVRVVEGVIGELVADGPTEAEVAVATGFLEGSLLLGLEDSAGRMVRLGRSMVQRSQVIAVDEHLARLRAITVDDVGRVLHRVLASPRAVAAVGPFDAGSFPLAEVVG